MKQVFTNPSVVPCDILRGLLEAEGIESMIKNERGSAMAGIGYPVPNVPSVPFAWPEVWVNDDDFEKAVEIASRFQREQQGHNSGSDVKGSDPLM